MAELVWTGICLQYLTLGFIIAKVHSRHWKQHSDRDDSIRHCVTK